MGVDIRVRTKSEEISEMLSRYFLAFTSGPDVIGQMSEYNQIEELLNIDLSIYRQSAPNLYPGTEQLEYDLWCAEEEDEQGKANALRELLEKKRQDWEASAPTDFSGWTKVEDLESTTKDFLNKLSVVADLPNKIKFNFEWDNYFDLVTQNASSIFSLKSDLDHIIEIAEKVKHSGEQYVTIEIS